MRNAAVFLEVADWLPDPLVLLRRSGEILAANRTAVRHLQLPETPLSGALLQSHVAGDYREVDVFIARCARTRGPMPGRIPIRLADGTVLSCRCSGGLFHQQGDGGMPLILLRIVRPDTSVSEFQRLNARLEQLRQEMTEARRASEERMRLEAQLMQAQKLESLGVLAGGIAHDFNNLLTGILGYIDLARSELPPGTPALPLLESAMTAAQRAAELTQQMLAYSGKGRFVVEPIDLSRLVSEMGGLLGLSVSKKAQIHYELPPGLPAVSGDATQLRQVVMNLIINASEAIGDRPGSISVTTSRLDADAPHLAATGLATELTPGPYVVLEVLDTGVGMTEETRQRLFDPFFTTKFTGRGLGLAAALGILRGHRGAITVQSVPGEGSRFRVYLPAVDSAVVPVREAVPPATAWTTKGRALVVDDDDAVLRLATRILQRLGFDVVPAEHGVVALDRFQQAPDTWDLVLLDMTMPHMDGRETFEAMRAIRPGVPTILMSGYNEQTATNRFVGGGVAHFLAKPFSVAQLTEIVQRLVAQRVAKPPY